MPTLELQLQDELSAMSEAIDQIEDFASEHQIPAKQIAQVNLCIDELLTNTITYGFDQPGDHWIQLRLQLDDNRLRIELTDNAKPFNPFIEAPPPDLDSPLEDRPIGGLGVYLVKSLMNHVNYHYRDGHNHILLELALATPTK